MTKFEKFVIEMKKKENIDADDGWNQIKKDMKILLDCGNNQINAYRRLVAYGAYEALRIFKDN